MDRPTTTAAFFAFETWWHFTKDVAADVNPFATTTWFAGSLHTTNNLVGPFANLVTGSHVWGIESCRRESS